MGDVLELFPDVPIEVKWVATAKTIGGPCAHCGRGLQRGRDVFKLAPACCTKHKTEHKPGSKNGPGSWVCAACCQDLTWDKE